MSTDRDRKRDRQRIHLIERPSNNPAEELAEVEIYKTQSITEDDFCVGLTARFGHMPISCMDWAYSVSTSIREAYVQIDTNNCALARDGRYGDATRPSKFTRERKVKSETTEKLSADGDAKAKLGVGASGFGLPNLGVALSAKGSKSTQLVASEGFKIKEDSSSITAAAGRKWRFSDLISNALQGKYEPHEHLCKISVLPPAKRGHVVARMFFYPKDIVLDVHEVNKKLSERIFKDRPNNVAVAKALLGKHLRALNPTDEKNIDGRIVVGLSRLDYKIYND